MREGAEGMYVGEEVVYQAVHDGKGADGLGGRFGAGRGCELCQGVCGIGGRRGVRLVRIHLSLFEPSFLLNGFGMAVGRTATAAWSLEGTRNVEGSARSAGRARFVALEAWSVRSLGERVEHTFTLRMLHESQAFRKRFVLELAGSCRWFRAEA